MGLSPYSESHGRTYQGSTGTNTNLEMREAQYEMSTQTQIQSHYRQYQWISHHEDQGTWPFPAASPLQTFIARGAFQSASPFEDPAPGPGPRFPSPKSPKKN